MAFLFVVGTPIGNLEDLTHRAESVLRSASVIACEDTRVTKKLLSRYDITTPTVSIHHHTPASELERLLDRVAHGENAAVVTDAGMPGVSDPGGKLIARAVERGIAVQSVPGPSALTAAVSLSGVPTDQFLFLGFLPHKKGRETLFKRIAATAEAVVLYESPHRLLKTLQSLSAILPTERQVVVCRELTKIHESVIRGSAETVRKHYTDYPDQVRGEIVIVIGS
ncbi:MAG: 16S rRNA (cytidine(1402)-2'-O)-methyltransferase [Patescibacteria group bacterium]